MTYAPHYIATGKSMESGDTYTDDHGIRHHVTSVVTYDTPWKPSEYKTAFFAQLADHPTCKTSFAVFAHGAKAEWREVEAQ